MEISSPTGPRVQEIGGEKNILGNVNIKVTQNQQSNVTPQNNTLTLFDKQYTTQNNSDTAVVNINSQLSYQEGNMFDENNGTTTFGKYTQEKQENDEMIDEALIENELD